VLPTRRRPGLASNGSQDIVTGWREPICLRMTHGAHRLREGQLTFRLDRCTRPQSCCGPFSGKMVQRDWAFSVCSRNLARCWADLQLRFAVVTTLPTPPQSPFSDSLLGLSFTMTDHYALCAFRRRLRRKAVWALITSSHHELTEAVQVYRPYELPGKAEPSWTLGKVCVSIGELLPPSTGLIACSILCALSRRF
jgi:hypothetical protein